MRGGNGGAGDSLPQASRSLGETGYQCGMTDERRAAPRIAASLPGEIETGTERVSVAFTRDVSPTGLLMLARKELQIGDSVQIKVRSGTTDVMVTGKVVRREDVSPAESTLWRFKVALAIEPSDTFDALMASLPRA